MFLPAAFSQPFANSLHGVRPTCNHNFSDHDGHAHEGHTHEDHAHAHAHGDGHYDLSHDHDGDGDHDEDDHRLHDKIGKYYSHNEP